MGIGVRPSEQGGHRSQALTQVQLDAAVGDDVRDPPGHILGALQMMRIPPMREVDSHARHREVLS
jgi:hypothetical protein